MSDKFDQEAEALLADWNAKYDLFIRAEHDEAAKFKVLGDMYGWNFHEGMAYGAIHVDVELRSVMRHTVAARLRNEVPPSGSG